MVMNPDQRNEDLSAALRAVQRRIANLRTQARHIEAQIAKAEEIARMIVASIDEEMKGAPHAVLDRAGTQRSPSSEVKESHNNGELVVKLSREILLEANRPLSRQEILTKINELGYTLRVANPPKFIGRTLWAHEGFVHIPQQGYWLANVDKPEVGEEGRN
jgi:hypothetical protein